MGHGLKLAVIQPLLRGAGSKVVEANLTQSEYSLLATRHNLKREVSLRIFVAIGAFLEAWQSAESLNLAKKMQERAEKNMKDAQFLVKNNSLPVVEMNQFQANLSSRKLRVYAAEKQKRDSALRLSDSLGVSLDEGLSGTFLSTLSEAPLISPNTQFDLNAIVRIALKRRSDLESKAVELAGADMVREAYKSEIIPSLSVHGSYSHNWPMVRSGKE